ncbi:unnamed protein product [Eruca vesicaria subsp. sativa]|uniref:Uncharacterized protein n=1 Tax=Eruca vesicaria subsp. sativa TaxID=29727 RepID=A0ABC8LHU9_ERUVS|nr:unnamed protein product [Eruca vesicaria subsp. sativa]
MSLVRCLSIRSVRRYRSSYACLIPLRDEEATRQFPETRSYHSFIHHQSSNFSRNRSSLFQSPVILLSHRTLWVLKSAVSNVYALHNVADALVSFQHLIDLLNAFTVSQWWVCIIVTSLLIRGVTIPVLIDCLNNIANGDFRFIQNVGLHPASAQEVTLNKVSLLSKSGRVMYTMLEKEFLGVKGSIMGKGIQVPVFWLSMEELRQNMAGILVSCLCGKTFSAELIRNIVLSKGRLLVVVGDGFGVEIQMFDLDFSLILKRRQAQKRAHQYHQYLLE